MQEKNSLSDQSWKELDNSGLMIPSYLTKSVTSAATFSVVRYITYRDLFNTEYTLEDLKTHLKKLSKEDCLASISKILTILENEGFLNLKVQQTLIKTLFNDKLTKVLLAELEKDPKNVFFFEQQLLVLAKYSVLFCSGKKASNYNNGKDFKFFSMALIGVSDLLVTQAADSIGEEFLQREALRNFYFNAKEDLGKSIVRVEELFVEIPELIEFNSQKINLNQLFIESTGLSVREYLSMTFSLIAMLSQQKFNGDNLNQGNWFINFHKYFKNTQVTTYAIDCIQKLICITTEDLKKAYKKDTKNSDCFVYKFSEAKKFPLVNIQTDIYYPISLRFLKERVAVSVYWIIFDYIKDNKTNMLTEYTTFCGNVFEDYVTNILKRIFPDISILSKRLYTNVKYNNHKKKTDETVDNMVVCADTLIFLETKIKRLKVLKTGIEGDLNSYRDDIDKLICKSMKQLVKNIKDFQSGRLMNHYDGLSSDNYKTYIPIIVVSAPFPQFPILWKIIFEQIEKEVGTISPNILDNLQIMDVSELQSIEALVEKGVSFEDIIKKKLADGRFKYLSYSTFLYYNYRETGYAFSQHDKNKFDVFVEYTNKFLSFKNNNST